MTPNVTRHLLMSINVNKCQQVAYSRPQNIKDKLIRAKLPPISNKPKRIIPGMHKCKSNCKICPYIKAEKVLKSTYTKTTVQITKHFNCDTSNLVYLI